MSTGSVKEDSRTRREKLRMSTPSATAASIAAALSEKKQLASWSPPQVPEAGFVNGELRARRHAADPRRAAFPLRSRPGTRGRRPSSRCACRDRRNRAARGTHPGIDVSAARETFSKPARADQLVVAVVDRPSPRRAWQMPFQPDGGSMPMSSKLGCSWTAPESIMPMTTPSPVRPFYARRPSVWSCRPRKRGVLLVSSLKRAVLPDLQHGLVLAQLRRLGGASGAQRSRSSRGDSCRSCGCSRRFAASSASCCDARCSRIHLRVARARVVALRHRRCGLREARDAARYAGGGLCRHLHDVTWSRRVRRNAIRSTATARKRWLKAPCEYLGPRPDRRRRRSPQSRRILRH